MTATSNQILTASIGGSVELLTLSSAGALLVYLGLFEPAVSSALSKAIYQLFIPALVFGSILDTAHTALESVRSAHGDSSALQELWVPVALALIIFTITAAIAFPLTKFIARRKEEAVRRAIFACLILGNANSMPLIVMQSLCDTFPPLQQGGKCYVKSMGYASLFMTVVNIVAWTALFQYILYSPDSSLPPSDEEQGLLRQEPGEGAPSKKDPVKEAIERALLSPPFLTVVAVFTLALIPGIPQAFLSEEGILRPLLIAVNTIGGVVVPMSCMIVGAELFRSIVESRKRDYEKPREEESFGIWVFGMVLFVRMILLPYIARLIYRTLGLSTKIANPLLGVFTLVEANVPTANNAVIMISIAADNLPRIGKQLRQDVSKCVFWQFLATPVFLTLNTAAALRLQFLV